MSSTLLPHQIPLTLVPMLVAAGVLGFMALHLTWIRRGPRGEAWHAWAVGWCSAGLVFLAGRFAQRSGGELGAIVGVKTQYTAGIAIGVISLGGLLALQRRPARRWMAAFVPIAGALAALVCGTQFIESHAVVPRVDALGAPYFSLRPGPGLPLLIAFVLSIGAAAARLLRQARPAKPAGRLGVFAFAFIAIALNDILVGLGAIRSVPLLDLAIAILSVAFARIAVQRADGEHVDLESAVEARTSELAHSRTELEQALHDLQRSELRFRQLSEATTEGVAIHADGVILDHNSALAEMLRKPDLVGVQLRSLVGEDARDVMDAVVRGSKDVFEAEMVRTDGTAFSAEITGRRVREGNSDAGVVTLRDVTESKQLRSSLAHADRLASLGTLAAGAAHEINNPLSWVSSNLEVLESELGRPLAELDAKAMLELRNMVAESRDGCRRVATLVRDLKSLSATGRDEIEAVDAQAAIESAIHVTASELKHRCELVRDLREVPPVCASEARLVQVLVNLIVNALQALPAENPERNRISISTRLEDAFVCIDVSDTGHGIPPELLPKIFDPFVTTKQAARGTGLGLSVCERIVSSFGGRLSVESTVGKGSCFHVFLPVAAASSVRLRVASGARAISESAQRSRVLILDDEPAIIRSLTRALSGHDVTGSTTVEEAIGLCKAREFDVILCDMMMKEQSGMDFHAALAETRPELCSRVVFMTGGAFTPEASAFLADPRRRCLDKPVDLAQLHDVIATARQKQSA